MPVFTPDEWMAIRLSLAVAARAVAFGLPIACLVAVVLSRGRFYGRQALDVVVHLPLVLPPVVVGWLLLLLFGLRGPVGAALHDWFGIRLVFTTAGAALACATMSFPLMVRAIRLSLDAIDPGLIDAARTLGASRWDRMFSIVLPLALPGIVVGAVITFAANIPGQTQTLPLAIYSALQQADGDATAARLSLVSVVLAVGDLLAAEYLGRRLRERLGR